MQIEKLLLFEICRIIVKNGKKNVIWPKHIYFKYNKLKIILKWSPQLYIQVILLQNVLYIILCSK